MDDVNTQESIEQAFTGGEPNADVMSGIDVLAGLFDSSAETDEVVPTTDDAEAVDVTNDNQTQNDESVESATGEIETAQKSTPLKFKAKIDHTEQDIELNPDELPALYQKANNFERTSAKNGALSKENAELKDTQTKFAALARTMGFEGTTDAEVTANMLKSMTESTRKTKIDEMVKKGTAREVAEYIVDSKAKDAASNSVAQTEVKTDEEPASSDAVSAEMQDDFNRLFALRPDLAKEVRAKGASAIPQEVYDVANKTGNLTVAYLDWESKQNAANASKSTKDNKVLRQNAASAKKAVVKGVSGQGTGQGAEDPLLRGLFGRS